MKIVDLKQNIFKENEVTADKIRDEFKKQGKLMINVMSSPGSGKTTTLLRTIERLKDTCRVGVMECDIDASVDAQTIEEGGAKAIQLHTGGMCHMDAAMTQQGLNEMGIDDVDLIFIENVGNLVCPAEFDTGAGINITILSVPEGDDKPAKYPLVYTVSDVVLINKVDALAVFDFDKELVEKRIHTLNPKAQIFYISAKKDEGFESWINYLKEKMKEMDSVGGIIECLVDGMPSGVGETVFDKLDANLAKAVMSIGAIKGIEFGDGFKVAELTGSTDNDGFKIENDTIEKTSNHAGGILGGMSDGSQIVLRAAVKPTPSIARSQDTINKAGENISINIKGRHDPIIVPRAVVVVESMVAVTLVDMLFTNMTARIDKIVDFYK